jgi:hypothetical protein
MVPLPRRPVERVRAGAALEVGLQTGSPTTKVSVSSRRGTTLDYDVSHARTVLGRIQQQQ